MPTEVVVDEASGLHAFIVIDSERGGAAVGGVRTRSYPDPAAALAEAHALARAMSEKCILAGLPTGGGKCVVLDHPRLDRPLAFAALGRAVEALGGRFRTAGDLGTTAADLAIMAQHTRYEHDEPGLAEAVARGHLACMGAVYERLERKTVVVQGAGAIGGAVAQALATAGMEVLVSDLDPARARAVAATTGAQVIDPDWVIMRLAHVFAPCAQGGVIDVDTAARMPAGAICGAANNVLVDDAAAAMLHRRGKRLVPDVLASAGAVIEGIGRTIMGLADRGPMIDALGDTTRSILAEAQQNDESPVFTARRRCQALLG
jgi:leucine dehydrogenase